MRIEEYVNKIIEHKSLSKEEIQILVEEKKNKLGEIGTSESILLPKAKELSINLQEELGVELAIQKKGNKVVSIMLIKTSDDLVEVIDEMNLSDIISREDKEVFSTFCTEKNNIF